MEETTNTVNEILHYFALIDEEKQDRIINLARVFLLLNESNGNIEEVKQSEEYAMLTSEEQQTINDYAASRA